MARRNRRRNHPGLRVPSPRARPPGPLDAGLGFLSVREHSVAELRTKLAARGHAPDDIEGTLEALAKRGLLSDQRFASAFLRSRRERGQGPLKIRSQLMQRGVGDKVIEATLAASEVDWDECASAARRRRFGVALPSDRAELAQQARFLRGRGFSSGQVARALLADHSS